MLLLRLRRLMQPPGARPLALPKHVEPAQHDVRAIAVKTCKKVIVVRVIVEMICEMDLPTVP